MAIITTPGWQVVAGGGLQQLHFTQAAAEAEVSGYAMLTPDAYMFEVVRYVYEEDE